MFGVYISSNLVFSVNRSSAVQKNHKQNLNASIDTWEIKSKLTQKPNSHKLQDQFLAPHHLSTIQINSKLHIIDHPTQMRSL